MSDDDTCGHDTTDDGTCEFTAKYPDGRCGHHTDTAENGHGGTLLEENPDIADLIAEEIGNDATVREALAEVEEKMGVIIAYSTHLNWMSRGKREDAADIFQDYRMGVRRARTLSCRTDRQELKQRCKEKGDTRTLHELHKEMYGDLYADDDDMGEESPPFAIPEELMDEWQQNTTSPQ